MNSKLNWSEFDKLARALSLQSWTFAKTMPNNPHHYCLKKKWVGETPFDWCVTALRANGYGQLYNGRKYTVIDINEHYYWTMGAPVSETILINRKQRKEKDLYAVYSGQYDDLYTAPEFIQEDTALMNMLGDLSNQSVLDVGCGTGLLLKYNQVVDYTGIDSSAAMIEKATKTYGGHVFINTDVGGFYSPRRYNSIIGLYGVGSYLYQHELERLYGLLKPRGRLFIMFYKPGYTPVVYKTVGALISRPDVDPKTLEGRVTEFGNYLVLEYGYDY